MSRVIIVISNALGKRVGRHHLAAAAGLGL
jgi:hypothetical protein